MSKIENEKSQKNLNDYEGKYINGYGTLYPEGHIIRVHKHILEYELNRQAGKVFDFGCGLGSNLKYFVDNGYEAFGCDTSDSAIVKARDYFPEFSQNLYVTKPNESLSDKIDSESLDLFISNQVFYYMKDVEIDFIVEEAYKMLKPGGVFVATMLSYECWFADFIVDTKDDFSHIVMDEGRTKEDTYMNLKEKGEFLDLFKRFKKLHLGTYSHRIREEEGSTDHWIFVGIKE